MGEARQRGYPRIRRGAQCLHSLPSLPPRPLIRARNVIRAAGEVPPPTNPFLPHAPMSAASSPRWRGALNTSCISFRPLSPHTHTPPRTDEGREQPQVARRPKDISVHQLPAALLARVALQRLQVVLVARVLGVILRVDGWACGGRAGEREGGRAVRQYCWCFSR